MEPPQQQVSQNFTPSAAEQQLAAVIQALYYGPSQQQAEANRWLSAWGEGPQSWRTALSLLNWPGLSTEVNTAETGLYRAAWVQAESLPLP